MGAQTGNMRIVFLVCLSCFGSFLFAYDTGIIGGLLTLDSFQKDFGFHGADKDTIAKINGLTASILQGGAFFGCIFCFPVAVRYGRRVSLVSASAVFMTGCALQAIPGSLAIFYAGRAISGLAVGACTVLIPIFTAEMSPKHVRGRLGAFFQLFFALGVCASYWIDYAVATKMQSSSRQWQLPVLLQFLPALAICAGMWCVPESCRWLAKRDRMDEARESLRWVRGDSTGDLSQQEMLEIMVGVNEEGRITQGLQWREAFLPANRYRLIVAIIIMLLQQLTGNTSLAYFAPQVFKAIAGGTNDTNILLTGFFGMVKVTAVLCFIAFFVDRVGRRVLFPAGALAMGCCMTVLAVLVALHPPTAKVANVSSFFEFSAYGRAAVAIVWFEAVCYNLSWGPLGWVYLGEIFPNRIREMGVATGAASQWLFNFTMSQITPHAIDNLGWKTFLMFAIFNFANAPISYWLVKETQNRSLEEMEVIFKREEPDTFEEAIRKFRFMEMVRRTRPQLPPERRFSFMNMNNWRFSRVDPSTEDIELQENAAANPESTPSRHVPAPATPPPTGQRPLSFVPDTPMGLSSSSAAASRPAPVPETEGATWDNRRQTLLFRDGRRFRPVPENMCHGCDETKYFFTDQGFRYYQIDDWTPVSSVSGDHEEDKADSTNNADNVKDGEDDPASRIGRGLRPTRVQTTRRTIQKRPRNLPARRLC